MPKEDIALSRDELHRFLAGQRFAVLVTGGDTHPRGELVSVELAGDELLAGASAQARRDVARDPRVCVVLEEQPDFAGIRGALVHGTARPEGDRLRVPLEDVVSFDFGKLQANRAAHG